MNKEIELAQCIFFDISDVLSLIKHQIANDDEIDCPHCMESHDSRKMFVETMTNIQDQAVALENRLADYRSK